jgi:hypothetical protein
MWRSGGEVSADISQNGQQKYEGDDPGQAHANNDQYAIDGFKFGFRRVQSQRLKFLS